MINYMFTIGFILLLVILIVSMVTISRIVLSDVTPIGAHVKETKSLLDNISEVSKTAQNNVENKTIVDKIHMFEGFKYNNNITDISTLSSRNNVSFITIKLDRRVSRMENMYYVDIVSKDDLNKEDMVLYIDEEGITHVGQFVTFEDERVVLIDIDLEEIIKVDFDSIVGEIIYINKNWKANEE